MVRMLEDIDLIKTYQKWYNSSGLFRCFVRSTNFVSLKHYPDFQIPKPIVGDAEMLKRIDEIISGYDPAKILFMFDFPNIISLDIARHINLSRSIAPILTFNNILHPFGVIGSKQYISKLTGYSEEINNTEAAGFAFIFDTERYGEYSDEELRKAFNNQYELTDEDLPEIEMLRDLGYEGVFFAHRGEIKEDISEYLDYLLKDNFVVIKEEL